MTLNWNASLAIDSSLIEVRELASLVRRICDEHNLPDETAEQVELVVVEAANNIIEHGYQGQPGNSVTLQIAVSKDAVVCELSDSGISFDLAQATQTLSQNNEINTRLTSGRGIGIIAALVDRIEYSSQDGQNYLQLELTQKTQE